MKKAIRYLQKVSDKLFQDILTEIQKYSQDGLWVDKQLVRYVAKLIQEECGFYNADDATKLIRNEACNRLMNQQTKVKELCKEASHLHLGNGCREIADELFEEWWDYMNQNNEI